MHTHVGFFVIMALLASSVTVNGQTGAMWYTLPNAPIVSRHNDAYFVTPTRGWIVNGWGQIYKTTDGGESWDMQFERGTAHFRSVAFLDSLRGWAGNVGPGEFGATDSAVFYQTTDGGTTWTPGDTFNGPKPLGLCGMCVVNDSIICAVGRVRGPSYFAKTTDGGNTWVSKDMSDYAAGLIDVYFPHPDTGFAVGLTNVLHDSSSGVVLSTADGGVTWEKRFTTSRKGEWCWKISFPSRAIGYVSLQRNSLTPIFILKTTNSGETWEEKLFSESYYFVQGIGFVSDHVGWVGGNSTFPTYGTADGGDTWQSAGFGARVNRFRFLSDTLGYAVGRTVYKYSTNPPTTVASDDTEIPVSFDLAQNYPNPFNPTTSIRYELPRRSKVSLKIYDLLGQEVATLVDQRKPPGRYEVQWQPIAMSSGLYFYRLQAGEFMETKKLLLLR